MAKGFRFRIALVVEYRHLCRRLDFGKTDRGDQLRLPWFSWDGTCSSSRASGGVLMDQRSTARHPVSATDDLTNQQGQNLTLGID